MNGKKSLVTAAGLGMALAVYSALPTALQPVPSAVKEADGIAASVDATIWPGFSFKQSTLFVFDTSTKGGLLFHVSPLPAGFVSIDPSAQDRGLGPLPGTEPYLEGAGPIGGRLGAWISAKNFEKSRGPKAVEVLYKGAFKVFEAYRGFPQSPRLQGASFDLLDAENNALCRAEGGILLRLLTAPKEDIPSLLAAFLSVRTRRQARLPENLRDYEWAMEVDEGLAAYAGFMARSNEDAGGAMADLAGRLESLGKGGKGVSDKRLVANGCALALALTKAGLNWKVDFERSQRTSLMPLIEKAAGSAAPADLSFVHIPTLEREEAETAAKVRVVRRAKLSAITRASGLVVVIDLQSALANSQVRWSNRYLPDGVTKLDQGRQIRERYFSLKGPGVLEFASSRLILVETRKSITAGFGADEIPYMTLDGKRLDLEKGQTHSGFFELKGNQMTLTVTNAMLSYTPKVLTVTPIVASQALGQP